MKPSVSLSFGPEVIQRLIPHRRPFLMVDAVESYERSPRPTLRASRHISANEPIFEGHFPGLCLWPGAYTIEGMEQSAHLLHSLWSLQGEWEARGADPEEVIAALANLELGYRLAPGYHPEISARVLEALTGRADARMGLSAAIKIKLLQPVFAGQRLDYVVRQTQVLDTTIHFAVEAEVGGHAVARGLIHASQSMPRSLRPGA
jgi:3-hydroxyacyl-[acyl-carrier-protein] dehydratase